MVPALNTFRILKLVLVPVLNNLRILKLVMVPVLNDFRILKLVLVPVLKNRYSQTGTGTYFEKFLHTPTGTGTSYILNWYCYQYQTVAAQL